MKHIYVNLKRFDVPASSGGVNRLSPPENWAKTILAPITQALATYQKYAARFTFFFPEAHLVPAVQAGAGVSIGCQSVHWEDVTPGGNFGAFTSLRPAAAAKELGCTAAIIGHCEERRALATVLTRGGVDTQTAEDAVGSLLAQSLQCAVNQNLHPLFCIGETAAQRGNWQAVLARQLEIGLRNLPTSARQNLVIAYEPVWAIGPGKTPPDADTIAQIARFIKSQTGGLPLVYGGGMKADNATMLSSIKELDGGLIALTRFAGEIGFYPPEYLEILRLYLDSVGSM